MYLRAWWARDFFMKPTSGDFETREGYRPIIKGYFLHIPDAYDDFALGETKLPGLEVYRAAAAHCTAHIVYTSEPISAEALNLWQIAVISVIEDARVETLAASKLPWLKHLWTQSLTITADQGNTEGDFLNRLARVLLDDSYHDDDP